MAKHDTKIKQLLNKIESEKRTLGSKPKISWNTNCLFRYDDHKHFNLNTVTDPLVLVEALAFLLTMQSMQEQAANRLGVDALSLQWRGYSVKDWEEDFKLKVECLKWNAQQKKLNALEKQLKSLVSEEEKTQMALDEIESML